MHAVLLSLLLAADPAPPPIPAPPHRPADCLGGICLGAKAPSPVAPVAKVVADQTWERRVEVCGGKVVSVELIAAWRQPEYPPIKAVAGAVAVRPDGREAVDLHDRLITGLEEVGWKPFSFTDQKVLLLAKDGVQGTRLLKIQRVGAVEPHAWVITFGTLHENYSEMCKSRDMEGL